MPHEYRARFWIASISCSFCFAVALLAQEPTRRSGSEVLLLDGKQLFIDNYVVDEMQGLRRVLNRPVKHPKNPLVVPDRPWEQHGFYANASTLYDEEQKLFKIWVHLWKHEGKELAATKGLYGYLTSRDGVVWKKPVINKAERNNRIIPPRGSNSFSGQGVLKDRFEKNSARRYKMIYTNTPKPKSSDYRACVAYSPDGITWTAEPKNPVIPFGDTQNAPLWDPFSKSYVAYVRTGPPNIRDIARIESKDFIHWSPKVTVLRSGVHAIDKPFRSQKYGMKVMPYAGCFLGFINMYHWETLGPIPQDKLWQDKLNVHLAFSRNGITWNRVGPDGALPYKHLNRDIDWGPVVERMAFLPYGRHKKDWDWGQIYAYHAPIVFNDKIWIYYTGLASRHWSNYHGDDRPPKSGIGLATLRLDGFISIESKVGSKGGTVTTRPFLFRGQGFQVNADARQGSVRVEILDQKGQPVRGFTAADAEALTKDHLRHRVAWGGKSDCRELQGRTIRLRFHLNQSKLFSFTPVR